MLDQFPQVIGGFIASSKHIQTLMINHLGIVLPPSYGEIPMAVGQNKTLEAAPCRCPWSVKNLIYSVYEPKADGFARAQAEQLRLSFSKNSCASCLHIGLQP